MRCPECKVYNRKNANFCICCGLRFNKSIKSQKKLWLWITFPVAIITISALTAFLYLNTGNTGKYNPDLKSHQTTIKNIHHEIPLIKPAATIQKNSSAKQTLKNISLQQTRKDIQLEKNPLIALYVYSNELIMSYEKPDSKNKSGLSRDELVDKLQKMIAINTANGHDREVADVLDIKLITVSQSYQLLLAAVNSRAKVYGFGNALKFVENLKDCPNLSENLSTRLNSVSNKLYVDWLNILMSKNKIADALDVFNFAGKNITPNTDLLISGIKIYLKENNWRSADKILQSIGPDQYNHSSKIRLLENQIKYLKSIEGKIALRFTPGSNYIPVRALLNNKIKQNFIIDTGATMVTIPERTARQLKLKYPSSRQKLKVATAGGTVLAEEVIIPSMTINNKTVYNIKALVLNLPSHPNSGLLGLSFLNRFHIEVNNTTGILLLTPK